MKTLPLLAPLLLWLGCTPGTSAPDGSDTDLDSDVGDDSDEVACTYPEGAAEPMALNEVLYPHSWPEARRADGTVADLDLDQVHCDDDEDIDWSPFDMLLFVSIPAW